MTTMVYKAYQQQQQIVSIHWNPGSDPKQTNSLHSPTENKNIYIFKNQRVAKNTLKKAIQKSCQDSINLCV
jgi:hypothetical protein